LRVEGGIRIICKISDTKTPGTPIWGKKNVGGRHSNKLYLETREKAVKKKKRIRPERREKLNNYGP